MTFIIDPPSALAPRSEWERFAEQARALAAKHPNDGELRRALAAAKAHLAATAPAPVPGV